jgi:hypothetical protein
MFSETLDLPPGSVDRRASPQSGYGILGAMSLSLRSVKSHSVRIRHSRIDGQPLRKEVSKRKCLELASFGCRLRVVTVVSIHPGSSYRCRSSPGASALSLSASISCLWLSADTS